MSPLAYVDPSIVTHILCSGKTVLGFVTTIVKGNVLIVSHLWITTPCLSIFRSSKSIYTLLRSDAETSDEIHFLYPGLDERLQTSRLNESCPTCISLGPDGTYFMRTDRGRTTWKLGRKTSNAISVHHTVKRLWFGKGGSWLAVDRDNSMRWDLQGHYTGLNKELKGRQDRGPLLVTIST